MLKDGKDGMVVFERFLLEVLKKDPNYNTHQPKELQLRKLIDRYTYILQRQEEIKGESETLEHEVENKIINKRKEQEMVFNKIIKLNSSIHKLTTVNEKLSNELKQIESNIQYHVDTSSSKLSRGQGKSHKADHGGQQPVHQGEAQFGQTRGEWQGRLRFPGQWHKVSDFEVKQDKREAGWI